MAACATAGDIIYASAATTFTKLPKGTAGQLLPWARDLHAMGQMFLKYGVLDINKMLTDIANQIASTGAIVDGGKSVH